LSEEQVNQTIDQVQDAIRSITKAPRRLASRAKHTVKDFQGNFEDYLRNTNKEELNPEGIKRDLQQLFNDPREGLKSVSDRLSHFDRDTLVSLLSQREDISEEEANRIADNVESVRISLLNKLKRFSAGCSLRSTAFLAKFGITSTRLTVQNSIMRD
jgi:hypothetical protein